MNKSLDKFFDTKIGNICVQAFCWLTVPICAVIAWVVFSALDRLKATKKPN